MSGKEAQQAVIEGRMVIYEGIEYKVTAMILRAVNGHIQASVELRKDNYIIIVKASDVE